MVNVSKRRLSVFHQLATTISLTVLDKEVLSAVGYPEEVFGIKRILGDDILGNDLQ
jgi:hypothetical protein